MNEIQNKQYSEFVFRRLSEPIKLPGGAELPAFWWLAILGVVLGFAIFYVVWMYRKDARGVGPYWATLLGALRLTVYAILALVFLLPAIQTGEDQIVFPSVAILDDVSGSMSSRDEKIEQGKPLESVLTRQQKVLNLLSKEDFEFLKGMMENGSLSIYRFGTRLDEAYFYFNKDRNGDVHSFTREEIEAWRKKGAPEAELPRFKGMLPRDIFSAWLRPEQQSEKDIPGLDEINQERLRKIRDVNTQMAVAGDFNGTNVPNSVLTLLERMKVGSVQGLVVFTDGKNTVQNLDAIEMIVERARAERIPVFFVGVGSDRPSVRIDVTNLRLPLTVRPDDSFKGVAEVVGMGLPDKEQDVVIDVSHVRITRRKVTVKVKMGDKEVDEVRDEVKEEPLALELVELDDKKADKDKARVTLTEGKPLKLGPFKKQFDRGPIPKLDAEFQIDARILAEAAGVTLDPNKKWELQTTETDPAGMRFSEMRFVARTPRHPDEVLDPKILEHVSRPVGVAVIKKKLNILIFSSSPSREYQFLRSMFQREVEKERVEFSIYLQNPPGRTERREGVLQDIDQDRFLNFMPYRRNQEPSADELAYWLPAAEKRIERERKRWKETADPMAKEPEWNAEAQARIIAGFYDLGNYDAIIALDPDWGRIVEEPRSEDLVRGGGKLNVPDLAVRLKTIAEWVENGGGMVAVGGAVNTIELARPRKAGVDANIFKPIQELYPVILQDIRVRENDNKAEVPYPLDLDQASPEMDFLRLKDAGQGAGNFLADWTEFFGKSKDTASGVQRGFYWFYPTEKVREGALVVARYNHPGAVMKDGSQQPFIVVSDPASGRRVVWLASGEFWRLRTLHDAYHERFWTKLTRYVAAGSQAKSNKRITLVMAPAFKANNYAEIEAKIETLEGRPLKIDPKTEKKDLPRVLVTVPQGLPPEAAVQPVELQPKAGAEGWYSGKFLVRFHGPGYRLELQVPRTGDTDTRSFDVEESNPEKDDTRPDFPLLYQMASEADEVLDRIKDEDARNKVRQALSRKPPTRAGAEKEAQPTSEKLKLFFDMSNAHLIPSCMTMEPIKNHIKGPVRDQWDDGFTIYTPADRPDEPVKVSYVLLLIVGLLSAEWLIRKLLRLA